MTSRCQILSVPMPDGSIVEVRGQLTKPGAKLTERDIAAIRACIHAISARRIDPKRADRQARRAQQTKSLCIEGGEHEDDGEGICLACGEPVSE